MFCKGTDKLLWNDVPADVRAKYEPTITYQPGGGWNDGIIPYHGWDKVPCMYLIADNDQALPPAYQEHFASIAKCKTTHVSLGHMAMLSGPEQVAEKLIEFIKS